MKFKTLRSSNTGMRFEKLEERIKEAQVEASEYLKEIGISEYMPNPNCIQTGIGSIVYPEGVKVPDYMKKMRGREYRPDPKNGQGLELITRWQKLPVVTWLELNLCVGVHSNSDHIGFSMSNKDFVLFQVNDDIDFKPPVGCEEITNEEYKALSNV